MVKKVNYIIVFMVMGVIFDLLQKSDAMEVEPKMKQSPQGKMVNGIVLNGEDTYKMLLFKQESKTITIQKHQEILPSLPRDVYAVIFGMLHKLPTHNPVLEGDLVYTSKFYDFNEGEYCAKTFTYRIQNHINKEGNLDLTDKEIFGDIDKYLILTTSVEEFVKKSKKLHILIAPKFLIQAKLKTIAKSFAPIIANWKGASNSIGIFWKMGNWTSTQACAYLIPKASHDFFSKYSVYELWQKSSPHLEGFCCSWRFPFHQITSPFIFKPNKK